MLAFVPLENTRSDVELPAGMANTILTTWNNRGNLFLFLTHQVRISFVSPISFISSYSPNSFLMLEG